MKKGFYIALILLSVFAFAINFANYINIGVSQKYEIEHARAMNKDGELIDAREAELKRRKTTALLIFLICFLLVGYATYKILKKTEV